MQALTLNHWIDELSKGIKLASDAASECVQQVAIRDPANGDDIAKGAESALNTLGRASKNLIALRTTTAPHDIIGQLSDLEGHISWVQHAVDLYMTDDACSSSNEVLEAVRKFRDAVAVLAADVAQIMGLDEVQEARMSYRAQAAKDKARAIADTLMP